MCDCNCVALKVIEDGIRKLEEVRVPVRVTERYYTEVQAKLLLLYQIKEQILADAGQSLIEEFDEVVREAHSCDCEEETRTIEVQPGQTIHLNITNLG